MGVNIANLFEKKTIELKDLSNKVITIDGYNMLYQFLSSIRTKDGTPLKDSNGNITAHLTGILYRLAKLLELGIKPIFIFDGKPPDLKIDTIIKRNEVRENATVKWEKTLHEMQSKDLSEEEKQNLLKEAQKNARATSRLTPEMVKESKQLLKLLGIPIVQAPSEGEAQAAYMVKKGVVDYAGSQDYDLLVFGATNIVRNLTVTGKRKLPGKNTFVSVKPELIDLKKNLKLLEIDQSKLIDMAIFIGTDYHPGIYKIGPKKALKLVKDKTNVKSSEELLGISRDEYECIRELFLNPKVTDDYNLVWNVPDKNGIINFLKSRDFTIERIEKILKQINSKPKTIQKTLF